MFLQLIQCPKIKVKQCKTNIETCTHSEQPLHTDMTQQGVITRSQVSVHLCMTICATTKRAQQHFTCLAFFYNGEQQQNVCSNNTWAHEAKTPLLAASTHGDQKRASSTFAFFLSLKGFVRGILTGFFERLSFWTMRRVTRGGDGHAHLFAQRTSGLPRGDRGGVLNTKLSSESGQVKWFAIGKASSLRLSICLSATRVSIRPEHEISA